MVPREFLQFSETHIGSIAGKLGTKLSMGALLSSAIALWV